MLSSDLEGQGSSREVHITHRKRDEDMTAAFNDPSRLQHVQRFALAYRYSLLSSHSIGPSVALHIGHELDKARCCYLILAGLVLSIVSGIAATCVTRRVDIGVGVSAAISAWVACVEAVLLWKYR